MAAPVPAHTGTPKPDARRRRVHVYRRPRTRRMQRAAWRALLIFVVVGALFDLLYPRHISDAQLKKVLAGSKGNATALSDLCGAPRPRHARVHSMHTTVGHERLLCWTPVERVALLHFADGARRAMLPASWARVRWLPLNPQHGAAGTRRLLASTARIAPDSLYVEYTSGFTPALELQRAALQALVAGSPIPLLASPLLVASHATRYARAFLWPPVAGAARRAALEAASVWRSGSKDMSRGARGLAHIVDRPFHAARRFATTVRARRNSAP